MHFDIFNKRADAHLRSVREYLQEANLARIQHQVAAEHHAALAAMYTQRVVWLEQEMTNPRAPWSLQGGLPAPQLDAAKPRAPASILNWPRPRIDGTNLPDSV
jgi:hypothetical protein